MIQTVEAVIDEGGAIRLLQPVRITGSHRALVTILDEEPVPGAHETALLSEAALAKDWNQTEKDALIEGAEILADEKELARRHEVVASVRAFQAKMAQKYGVQPDSSEIIREARDHPRA